MIDRLERETSREFTLKTRTDKNLKEPSVFATGIGTVNIGQHYDLIIADDLHSEKNTSTKEQIEKVIAHYRLLLSLLEPDGTLIIIGTRWHFYDLYSFLLEEEIEEKDGVWDVYIERAIRKDGSLFFPSRLTKEFLAEQRKAQGSYVFHCNPKEAPILMADFSVKKISEVVPGDEIVGFISGNKDNNSRLVKTKVLEVNSRIAKVQKMYMGSGRIIRCTPDHQWFMARQDKTHRMYAPAKIGTTLRFVVDPFTKQLNEEEKRWAYWLGGIFDGEGSCSGKVINIAQSKTKNSIVHGKIIEALTKLKYNFNVAFRKSGAGDGADQFWINGGMDERRRFLLECQPQKKDGILRSLYCSKFATKDKVINIEPDKRERVYALTTETGNYIVWGYASKNCQYCNDPVSEETQKFKREYFQYWGADGDLCPTKDGKRILLNIYILIDRAFSSATSADFTGCVCVGVSSEMNLYVLEAERHKCGLNELADIIYRWINKYGKDRVKYVGVESINWEEIESHFKQFMDSKKNYFNLVRLTPDSRMRKNDRIEAALEALYSNKKVYHRKRMMDLEDELVRFPVGTHEDIIDAFAYIKQVMSVPSNVESYDFDYNYEPSGLFNKVGY
jgi:phage terminase large subunit-like protein